MASQASDFFRHSPLLCVWGSRPWSLSTLSPHQQAKQVDEEVVGEWQAASGKNTEH